MFNIEKKTKKIAQVASSDPPRRHVIVCLVTTHPGSHKTRAAK